MKQWRKYMGKRKTNGIGLVRSSVIQCSNGEVDAMENERELYNVAVDPPKLVAWIYNDELVYTKSQDIDASTKLYNKDMTLYTGGNFKIKEVEGIYKVVWRDIEASRATNEDIYSTPFLTKKEDGSN
jgi:hypothetical protein